MTTIKKQFDKQGNLVLQAIVEDGKIHSVRCFQPDGHELPLNANTDLFELDKDGMVRFKEQPELKGTVKGKSLSDMFDEFKAHEQNRSVEMYENRTGAVSGDKMVEEAVGSMHEALHQLASNALTNYAQALEKVKNATAAFGGSVNGKEKQEEPKNNPN